MAQSRPTSPIKLNQASLEEREEYLFDKLGDIPESRRKASRFDVSAWLAIR
jgi:hypothetical protein